MFIMISLLIGSIIGFSILQICLVSSSGITGLLKTFEKLADCPEPPMICPNVNITFHLFNRRIQAANGYQLKEYKPMTIRRAPFIKHSRVIISSHGFRSDLHNPPNPQLINAYRRIRKPANIIVLNWGPLCQSPCYPQAARNVVLVGKCTAIFIQVLLKNQRWFGLKHIQFIGFSLGAQVGGQVARHLSIGKLSRITALDAAWPLFDPIEKNAAERLDKSDADFVDAYHTNAGENGQPINIGHVDFYANRGLTQPGCGSDSSCDHRRSVLIYSESIYSKKGFYAYPCSDILTVWTQTCRPKAGSPPVLLGAYVDHNNWSHASGCFSALYVSSVFIFQYLRKSTDESLRHYPGV